MSQQEEAEAATVGAPTPPPDYASRASPATGYSTLQSWYLDRDEYLVSTKLSVMDGIGLITQIITGNWRSEGLCGLVLIPDYECSRLWMIIGCR